MKKDVKIYDNGVIREISVEEFNTQKKNGEKFVKPEGTDFYVPVSNEIYSEIMRPIWRENQRVKRSLECIHKNKCISGNCDSCTKHEYFSDSLEFVMENGGIDLPNSESAEEIFCRKLFFRELNEALSGFDEVDKKIFEMILDDKSERAMAEQLGFKSKNSVKKRREKLLKKFEKNFFENR